MKLIALAFLMACCLLACDNSPSQQYRDNEPNPSITDSSSNRDTSSLSNAGDKERSSLSGGDSAQK